MTVSTFEEIPKPSASLMGAFRRRLDGLQQFQKSRLTGRSKDPFARAGSGTLSRVEFISGELALCFTFSVLAATKYEAGNRTSAEQSLGHAEEVYAAVLPLVSDPQHSKHLSREILQEFTAESERLRESLDGLQRLRR